jgi:AcrR family transcriptional regulator
MLRDALVALVIERGWDEIGIQDVCERANVGRSTFYTHFADKEELLLEGFEDLRRMLRQHRAAGGDGARRIGFSLPLLEHAHENKRLFRALVGKRSSQVVQRRFQQLVVDLTKEELGTDASSEPVAQYVAGAFFQLVLWWTDARSTLSPEELDETFQRLTRPVLAQARTARR